MSGLTKTFLVVVGEPPQVSIEKGVVSGVPLPVASASNVTDQMFQDVVQKTKSVLSGKESGVGASFRNADSFVITATPEEVVEVEKIPNVHSVVENAVLK